MNNNLKIKLKVSYTLGLMVICWCGKSYQTVVRVERNKFNGSEIYTPGNYIAKTNMPNENGIDCVFKSIYSSQDAVLLLLFILLMKTSKFKG
ncbi:hypothetical protein MAR_003958 [Mya arenaria]|uniref:Uncharacterized protein n=1 Tax=Mya arenaria TaxID=6604 RepID=A0ABY7EZD2_MYAAR|nr:hypothetical protein MAR_003958 [Mya arenaria]